MIGRKKITTTRNRSTALVISLFFLILLQACDQSAPAIDVSDPDVSVQSDPVLKLSTNNLDFGFVEAGDTAVMTLALTHTGDSNAAPVTIQSTSMDELDSLHYTNEFYGAETLYPGESVNLNIAFYANCR